MKVRLQINTVLALALLGCAFDASAFRSCGDPNTQDYSAASQYIVGEVDFDEITGMASGTETTYNYGHEDLVGFSECHVTYELSGSYMPGGEIFILDATRTNNSASCPAGFIDAHYPQYTLYSFHMAFNEGGESVVTHAASGELVATGSWAPGRTAYKTEERCVIF